MSTQITLVRHGEVHNPDKIMYGRLPNFRLSDVGQAQAHSAAQALRDKPVSALYVSPQLRAQQTAKAIHSHHPSVPFVTDARLDECLTPHEGRSQTELDLIQYEVYKGNQAPYETERDLRARLVAWLNSVRQAHHEQHVIGVTHGDMVVSALLYAVQHPIDDIGRGKLMGFGLTDAYPATACLLTLSFQTQDANERPAWAYQRPY
jgi:broad specificity phosphatase PhoE